LTLAALVQQYTSLVKDLSFSLHLIDQQQVSVWLPWGLRAQCVLDS
jgi:hypothetical protein